MTVFYFINKHHKSPNDFHVGCFDLFWKKFKKLSPGSILGVNMHITLNHHDDFHEAWVTFYDTGKFQNFVRDEKVVNGKLCKKFHIEESEFNPNDPKKKKYTGNLPTKKELEQI